MPNITGQSIAAASDSITRNGKGNTALGMSFVVGGGLLAGIGILTAKYYFNKRSAKNKLKNALDLEGRRHEDKMEEIQKNFDLKKFLIEMRNRLKNPPSPFASSEDVNTSDDDALVDTYDDLVSGEDVSVEDQRLGVRYFHFGMDCGAIGRTQVGKTSMFFHFAVALVNGYPNAGKMLSHEWHLSQPVKVLYFAFEQNKLYFKTKYGKVIKSIPNLSVETKIGAGNFEAIQKKIVKMQNEIGNYRLVVFFDNITKMKGSQAEGKKEFFQWLEDYRIKCDAEGKPITYIKIFHTQGSYKDYMPIDATTNYGSKSDTYFTQDLVAFGVCKGGNGKIRYIKELKNKIEPEGEKTKLSIFRFADTPVPMYEYVDEAEECDVLPTKADMVRGSVGDDNEPCSERIPVKRGRKEDYSEAELKEIYEEHKAGFSWREILIDRKIIDSKEKDKDKIKNKTKTITKALKRHGYKL